MVGIDITSIERFKNKDEKFAEKILSNDELINWKNIETKDVFLATRWAIKEAIFKCDNKYFNFREIDIKKIDNKYCFSSFGISTSRENDYIIAIAIKIKDVMNEF
ncbi:MAG: 4'-phosphopantetheinyl transferase superfamily protein [Metamycoplasmataceae bacterium]